MPFIALAICKAVWNLTVLTLHTLCHGHSPALVLPSGWGHFPVMDAGGSPFPHNDGASVDGGAVVVTGTVVSGAFCSDPTGGSSVPRPISSGSASGNATILLYIVQGTCFVPSLLPGVLAEQLLRNVRV